MNSDLIEQVEVTPDTVLTLVTGQKMMVLESPNEVVRKVIEFRRAIHDPALQIPEPFAAGELEESGLAGETQPG